MKIENYSLGELRFFIRKNKQLFQDSTLRLMIEIAEEEDFLNHSAVQTKILEEILAVQNKCQHALTTRSSSPAWKFWKVEKMLEECSYCGKKFKKNFPI